MVELVRKSNAFYKVFNSDVVVAVELPRRKFVKLKRLLAKIVTCSPQVRVVKVSQMI